MRCSPQDPSVQRRSCQRCDGLRCCRTIGVAFFRPLLRPAGLNVGQGLCIGPCNSWLLGVVLYARADVVAVAALVVVVMPAGLHSELWASSAHTHTRNHSTSVHPTDLTQHDNHYFFLSLDRLGESIVDGTKWLPVVAGSTLCCNPRGGVHVGWARPAAGVRR